LYLKSIYKDKSQILKIKNATNSRNTKSQQCFVKTTLVAFGVSVNWWQLTLFKLPTRKGAEKDLKTKVVE